jgi:hypothetical protein
MLLSANIAFRQTFQRSICCELPRDLKDITLKPHSRIELSRSSPQLETKGLAARNAAGRARSFLTENYGMATRERRLAEFNGNGEPPPDQPVQVLCEDHSGTYQLPFACRWVDGEWRNEQSGGIVEATVVGWRLPRS